MQYNRKTFYRSNHLLRNFIAVCVYWINDHYTDTLHHNDHYTDTLHHNDHYTDTLHHNDHYTDTLHHNDHYTDTYCTIMTLIAL